MMEAVIRVDGEGADAVHGRAVLDWPKLIWNFAMLGAAIIFAIPTFSWSALLLFICLTYATLLIGHSVGMHRMMIHRSFRCKKPLEYLLIYIGVLVGVAGPFGILRIHDLRDWAQRQPKAHDFFTHRRWVLPDLLWNLAYRFEFERAPTFHIEPNLAQDRFYRFMEATWRWQQIPLAVLLFYMGGWAWVIWGICLRVSVSTIGHWTITYYCHNPQLRKKPGRWRVKGAGVQAANLIGPWSVMGLLTYGECWHNNHHAFPESAQIGLEKGQYDPAWWIISALERAGLADKVGRPRSEDQRDDLHLRF